MSVTRRTATQLRRKLRKYSIYLSRQCPGVLTAKDIYGFLGKIMNVRLDFFARCTKSESRPCNVQGQLVFWNLILQDIKVEMAEVAPETLGIGPPSAYAFGSAVRPGLPWAFLHWLLREHHCVRQLQLRDFMSPRFPTPLLCDALRLSSGLTTLMLEYEFSEEELTAVLPALGTLQKLESLHLSKLMLSRGSAVLLAAALQKFSALRCLTMSGFSIPFGGGADCLGTVLCKMSALTSLSLSCARIDPSEAELLVQALTPSVTSLDIDDHLLKPGGGAALAEYIARNKVLKTLRLTQEVCFEMIELEKLLRGLALNHSLEELHLSGFGLQKPAMELLAETVGRHEALKTLEIVFFDECWQMDGTPLAMLVSRNTGLRELSFTGGDVACCAAFAEAIRENTTLQKLTLDLLQPDDAISVAVYRELLEALSRNSTLRELSFGLMYSSLLSDFGQLLRETKTETRVKVEVNDVVPRRFTDVLRNCTGLSEMRCSSRWSKVPVPLKALEHLVDYYRLEYLTLDLNMQLLEGSTVTCLARFLSTSRTLRSANLDFLTAAASTRVLLQALCHNRSISDLFVRGWEFGASEADLFYRLLKSTNILNDMILQPRDHSRCLALSGLTIHLLDNYSLLSLRVFLGWNDEAMDYMIKDITHRNTSLMYRAVRFVLGSRERRFVEAFELVWRSPALVKEVQKLALESEETARERVKCQKRYLDENFLAATGVVKDAVVCIKNGQLQIDQIGLDNWLQIRRYLRVTDIKGPETVEVRCRKRRLQSH
ncbi:unnamed protein product [Ixodes hexagonus]